jgi:hypothetical protein
MKCQQPGPIYYTHHFTLVFTSCPTHMLLKFLVATCSLLLCQELVNHLQAHKCPYVKQYRRKSWRMWRWSTPKMELHSRKKVACTWGCITQVINASFSLERLLFKAQLWIMPYAHTCCSIGCRLFCLIEYIASIVLTIKERVLQDFWLKHCIGDDDLLARKTSSGIVRYISISAISMI